MEIRVKIRGAFIVLLIKWLLHRRNHRPHWNLPLRSRLPLGKKMTLFLENLVELQQEGKRQKKVWIQLKSMDSRSPADTRLFYIWFYACQSNLSALLRSLKFSHLSVRLGYYIVLNTCSLLYVCVSFYFYSVVGYVIQKCSFIKYVDT